MRLWRWVCSWWHRRKNCLHPEVVLYTRNGCHLCDDAFSLLQAARGRHGFRLSVVDVDSDPALAREHGFRLSVVDVDSDPALAREHGESVPVVTVAGKVRFRGRVNEVLLERLLRAEKTHL